MTSENVNGKNEIVLFLDSEDVNFIALGLKDLAKSLQVALDSGHADALEDKDGYQWMRDNNLRLAKALDGAIAEQRSSAV